MTRIFALLVTVIATAIALATDELPGSESDEPESFDIEPAPLIQNRPGEQLSPATAAGDVDVVRLEKTLERAKKNASGAERLCKIGVLATVEVEQRALKVVRLESDLANAQVARAKAELVAQESQLAAGESTKDELETAKAALAQLTEAAQIAAAKRERAELEAAEANVHRQEKLLHLGSAHKSDVNRAQKKLAELKAPKN
jgi:multidrug efflux pump subunit AcrA (membrane-fusion protein)